jgi:hypothetical protein
LLLMLGTLYGAVWYQATAEVTFQTASANRIGPVKLERLPFWL